MRYVVETEKTAEQALADLQAAVKRHQFGVLHAYDLQQTLRSKGFELPNACHILEICSPRQASEVLRLDMGMNLALPCRISVYEEAGRTKIGMMRPTALLASLSESPDLKRIAEEVERATIRMIDESR